MGSRASGAVRSVWDEAATEAAPRAVVDKSLLNAG
jgi:hypothetical protein